MNAAHALCRELQIDLRSAMKAQGTAETAPRQAAALDKLKGNFAGGASPLARKTYHGTLVRMDEPRFPVERVQTGVRLEKRLLKVLKAVAEWRDVTLGDLLEGIVLHAFDGKCAFEAASLAHIREFKRLYGLELGAGASHKLVEAKPARTGRKGPR